MKTVHCICRGLGVRRSKPCDTNVRRTELYCLVSMPMPQWPTGGVRVGGGVHDS